MSSIAGRLYAEAAGPANAPTMVFVHPNPMDRTCWMFQMAHFSTWYHCLAIDLPGYGRSPAADAGLTMREIAEACWSAVDEHSPGSSGTVLVGCSVGSAVVEHMYHLRPDRTRAVVLSGTGYRPGPVKAFALRRIEAFRQHGLDYRRAYTLELFSPSFARSQLAEWLAAMFSERNGAADLETIIRMFQAHSTPDPEWLLADLAAPVLVVSGSLDSAHRSAFDLCDRLPEAEMVTIEGAGHACFLEQPWVFDEAVIRFLLARGIQSA